MEGRRQEPREPTAAIVRIEGHGLPARLHIGGVGIDESRGRRDRAILVPDTAVPIARNIEWRDRVLDEPPRLAEQGLEQVDVSLREVGKIEDRACISKFFEDELDVPVGAA